MKQELRLQQNNEGFSLVELIVTILISSVVMAGVVGQLITGLNLYKNVDAETRLQIEGQAACGRIDELVQEAQYLRFYSSAVEDNTEKIESLGANKVLVLMTLEGSGNGWWYYIAWDEAGQQLLLTKTGVTYTDGVLDVPDKDAIAGRVNTMLTASNKKKYLLAQYVKTFNFSDIGTKLYHINVLLETDSKQFSAGQIINGRNK